MIRRLLLSCPALVLLAGAAHATPITVNGSYSLSTTGTSGVVNIANNLASPFSLPLTIGTPDTLNFITLTPAPGNGTNTYNFTITAGFAFTLPGTGSKADLGTGALSVQGNSINGGSLTWADGPSGTNITLSDGSVLNLNLSDIANFSGSARGGNPQTVTATFTLVSDPPPAVPEPATLLLLGSGLFGLAALRRRKRNPLPSA